MYKDHAHFTDFLNTLSEIYVKYICLIFLLRYIGLHYIYSPFINSQYLNFK